jgi:hypothetical protein
MSKYDLLTEIYRQARNTFRQDEETCRNFARELVFGLIEYYEWPQSSEITYIPLGEELDPNNKFYALKGAMRMDAQSFWHFGVELKLQESSGAYPISLVLSFYIKKMGDRFIVRLGPKGKEIAIPEEKQGQLEPFFDLVYRHLEEFFKNRYVRAVTKQETELEFITLLLAND